MSSAYNQFKDLHQSLLILPNIWDAKSASIIEEQKFPAAATSSKAVANTLGYEDGQQMSFEEYFFVVKRIIASVKIPVTVDMEMGYGSTNEEILVNMQRLAELGVAGINIEDSSITNSVRGLKDAETFAATIEYIKNKLISKNLNLFINLRCDTYILNVPNKQQETNNRLKLYNNSGADGIFLPCITAENDIAEAISNTKLPLNVMCIPGLPDLDTLKKLGVKRVSMGPFLFSKIYNNIAPLLQTMKESKSVSVFLS